MYTRVQAEGGGGVGGGGGEESTNVFKVELLKRIPLNVHTQHAPPPHTLHYRYLDHIQDSEDTYTLSLTHVRPLLTPMKVTHNLSPIWAKNLVELPIRRCVTTFSRTRSRKWHCKEGHEKAPPRTLHEITNNERG